MRFFLQLNGQTEGPFTVEEIEDLHGSGRVNRSTPCRPDGKGDWSSIYNLVPTAIWVTSPRNKPVLMKSDPPDRSGLTKKILWIGLSCVIALAIVVPIFGIVAEEIASKDRITQLQAPAPPPVSLSNPAGMQRVVNADLEKLNKQMEETHHAAAAVLGVALLFPIIMGGIAMILFAFWLWMLINVVTTEPEGSDKIVWTLLVVFTGPLGAAIYFFARYVKMGSLRNVA
ncbi:MAG: GYF domain-containing protein [Terrimicrobiaceae bacterium]